MTASAPELNVVEPRCRGLRERPELDAMLAPRPEGYLGADVGLSIPLPGGDVLWLFGDTLMGSHDGQRRTFGDMPRNTAAIQKPGEATPEAIQWAFRPGNTDFLELPPHETERWFWPGTGAIINGELFIFGYGVSRSVAEHEALSFRLDEPWMMRVRNPSGDPLSWKIEPSLMTNAPKGGPWFCSACCVQGDFLYLMGYREDVIGGEHRMQGVVARIRTANLLADSNDLEFWCGNAMGWRDYPAALAITHNPGVSECSLYYDAPRRRYLATTYRAHKAEFYLISAPHPQGPWSEAKPIFRLPFRNGEHGALGYALRMHPHLPADRDEIVLSYLVNTYTPAALADDLTLYHPRFVSIPLTAI